MRRFAAALLLAGCSASPPAGAPVAPSAAPEASYRKGAQALRVYLTQMLEAYRADCGGYPTKEQGLAALFARPEGAGGWRGPYLDGRPPVVDPWGREFAYRSDGRAFELASAGADGRLGTADDIGGTP